MFARLLFFRNPKKVEAWGGCHTMGHFEGKEGRDKGRTLIFFLRGKEGEWKREEDLARAILVRGVQRRKEHLC